VSYKKNFLHIFTDDFLQLPKRDLYLTKKLK